MMTWRKTLQDNWIWLFLAYVALTSDRQQVGEILLLVILPGTIIGAFLLLVAKERNPKVWLRIAVLITAWGGAIYAVPRLIPPMPRGIRLTIGILVIGIAIAMLIQESRRSGRDSP